MAGCFAGILECVQGPSYNATSSYAQLHLPTVKLDEKNKGSDVVILKHGARACGQGGVRANTAINQDKAYFEVKIQQTGPWGIGLCGRNAALNDLPLSDDAFMLRHDGHLYSNGNRVTDDSQKLNIEEGDVIGLTFDHVELSFYINSRPVETKILNVKGTVYPAIFVDEEAILDMHFDQFFHQPPRGFIELMMEQNLL